MAQQSAARPAPFRLAAIALGALLFLGMTPLPHAAAKADPHLTTPSVPAIVYPNTAFGLTGSIDKAAATGPIKLLFYQKVRGSWVLQKTVYAKWSGWTSTKTRYVADVSVPYTGTWRVGASYGGNATYASAYKYRDFSAQTPYAARVIPSMSNYTPKRNTGVVSGAVVADQKGAALAGATVTFVWHFKNSTWKGTTTTDVRGTARVSHSSGGTEGYRVTVNVTASKGGHSVTGVTSFVPQ